MAGKMISELGNAVTLQITDTLPIARGSTTLKLSGGDLVTTSQMRGLSSYADTKFIPKPASASASQVLTYNASTTTWVASAAPTGAVAAASAKAWVNFNGTTSPGTIRSSYNVSSVVKNSTGNYTVVFATPMTDTNYVTHVTAYKTTTPDFPVLFAESQTLSSVSMEVGNRINGNLTDSTIVMVLVFGN